MLTRVGGGIGLFAGVLVACGGGGAGGNPTGTAGTDTTDGTDGTSAVDPRTVGEPGFSSGVVDDIDVAVHGEVAYVAYIAEDKDGGLFVQRWQGGAWTALSSPVAGVENAQDPSVAADADGVYLAYSAFATVTGTFVVRHGGAGWETLGAGPAAGGSNSNDLVLHEGVPWVITSHPADETVQVRRLAGDAWELVGAEIAHKTEGFENVAIAFDGAGALIAMTSTKGIRLRRLEGDAWVSAADDLSDSADFLSLAASGGSAYLAYRDMGHLTVPAVLELEAGQLSTLPAPSTIESAQNLSIVVRGGVPWLAWTDYSDPDGKPRALVSRFADGAWTSVVDVSGAVTSLGAGDGPAYLGFQDHQAQARLTVLKLD